MPNTDEPIVILTERATQLVLDSIGASKAPLSSQSVGSQTAGDTDEVEGLALWVEVLGRTAGKISYGFHIYPVDYARDGDAVYEGGTVTTVVPSHSIGRLQDATIDVEDGELGPTFVVINPHHEVAPPDTKSSGHVHEDPPLSPVIGNRTPVELSGTVEERIRRILKEQVNPSIAVHGGKVGLVSVEDGRAYLRMEGSCVGCGLASATLNEGIATVISQALPEIEAVIDITDHASGTNPFYTAPHSESH